MWQLIWLAATVIARWAQHLPLSLLELNTFVNIIFAFFFYMFWQTYPVDITHPIVVDSREFKDFIALMLMASGIADSELYENCLIVSRSQFLKQTARFGVKDNASANDESSLQTSNKPIEIVFVECKGRALRRDNSRFDHTDRLTVSWEARHSLWSDAAELSVKDIRRRNLAAGAALKEDWNLFDDHDHPDVPRTKISETVKVEFSIWELQGLATRMPNVVFAEFTSHGASKFSELGYASMYTLSAMMFLAIPLAIHGSLHLIAWNNTFPTPLEKMLWKLACFALILNVVPQIFSVQVYNSLRKRDHELEMVLAHFFLYFSS